MITGVLRVLLVIAFGGVALADPRLKVEPPDPDAIAAKQIIDDAIVAKGGRPKLAAIKAIRTSATGTTVVSSQPVAVELERAFVVPDRIRIDVTVSQSVKVTVVADGQTGWQLSPDPKTGSSVLASLSRSELDTVDAERLRDPDLILLKASEVTAKLSTAPDEKLDGRSHSIVKLRTRAGVDMKLYFDKGTRMLSRLSYDEAGTTATDDFSDYKVVKGIQIAHKRISVSGPRKTTLQLTFVDVDAKIDPKIFREPVLP